MDGEFPLWIQCSIVGDSCYKIFHEILKTAFQHALDILSYLPCWQIVMLWKILLMPNLYFCICLEISTVFIMSKSLPSSFFFFLDKLIVLLFHDQLALPSLQMDSAKRFNSSLLNTHEQKCTQWEEVFSICSRLAFTVCCPS